MVWSITLTATVLPKRKINLFDGTRLRHTNGELNFANVSWAERVGLQRQDYIEGFGEGVETPFTKRTA